MPTKMTATVVAAEFVPDGDPWRDDETDEPRPAGTYMTIRLDDKDAAIVGGAVVVEYVNS